MKYKRILLKLSGEALMGERSYGIDPNRLADYADEIKSIVDKGVEVAIVIGGGNIFRGLAGASNGMDRVQGDYMGMLATIINGLALQSALEEADLSTRLLTSIEMKQIAEPFIKRRAVRHLEKGRVVIFGGGTGNPYFTTDTAASLRAMEMGADIILKATKVDGIYDRDPVKDKEAKFYKEISYLDCLNQSLKVMDSAAISLCMDYKMPILVFNLTVKGNIRRALLGDSIGTLVTEGK